MDKSLENLNNQLLLISAANGEAKNVQKYLSEGAYVDIKDANGYTPLMCASYNKHIEVVKILVESGADVNLKDTNTYGFTVLHFASAYGLTDMVKVILKTQQKNIHEIKSTKEGKTAIELASTKEIQDLLINDLVDRTEKKLNEKKEVEIKSEEKKSDDVENLNLLPKLENEVSQEQEQPILNETETNDVCAEKCKKVRKVFRGIGILIFFLLPLLHLWFSPYGFPLFIYPCGLILTIFGLLKLKKRKDELQEKGIYHLSIAGLIFGVINGIFVWSNLWGGGFPWSLITLAISGLFLAVHALKTKYKESEYNTKFHIHALFFSVFAFIVLVIFFFGTCRPQRQSWRENYHYTRYKTHQRYQQHHYYHQHYQKRAICDRSLFGFLFFMIPVFIWGIILAVHYMKSRKVKSLGFCGMKVTFGETEQQQQ